MHECMYVNFKKKIIYNFFTNCHIMEIVCMNVCMSILREKLFTIFLQFATEIVCMNVCMSILRELLHTFFSAE